jgi:hypothetical protein
MGQFLRDQVVANITLNLDELEKFNERFIERTRAWNNSTEAEAANKKCVVFYVIRFDGKGYRYSNFDDVKRDYSTAKSVERVIFTADSIENRGSQGFSGTMMSLCLDVVDANACRLTVTADHQDWASATFGDLSDILNGCRNWSGFVRTQWTGFFIQLFGLVVGFLLSVWAAANISPLLKLDNPFGVAFFLALLLYSNVWGYVNSQILRLINHTFPNIRFRRAQKDAVHWIVQGLIGAVLVALLFAAISDVIRFASRILNEVVLK